MSAGPECEALRTHLEWADGSWVGFVFAEDERATLPLREVVLDWAGPGGADVLLPETPADLREVVRELVTRRSRAAWLEATGAGPTWEDAWRDVLVRLDERRERLRRIEGGLILVGHPSAKELFRTAAPDLWSARALVLEPPTPEGSPRPRQAKRRDAASWERRRIARRFAEVEALLAQGWASEALPASEALVRRVERAARDEPAALVLEADVEELAGRVAMQLGEPAEARRRYLLALPLRRRLARGRGSERHRRRAELARSLSVLGDLAAELGDAETAEAELAESVALRRRLVRWSDDRESLAELAIGWSLLGDLKLARHDAGDGRLREAIAALQEAVRLRERIAGDSPDPRSLRLLSVSVGKLGSAMARDGDHPRARACFERAAELARRVADSDPGNVAWRMEATVSDSRLADADRARGDLEGALERYLEVVAERERLSAEDPQNIRWKELTAAAFGRASDTASELEDATRARRLAHRALGLAEEVAWHDPQHPGRQDVLGRALLRLATLERRAGRQEAASRLVTRAAEVARRLYDRGGEARRRGRDLAREIRAGGWDPEDGLPGPVEGG
ncbi:MAG: tetratricopeptide repeat protein [Alphaproteobacteria bacterium]|nr:tetratricopeptide repeat protein [Alphaproteobacteria bacterium]MCB9698210.1 tetratricopeptide repeat protein [Alphaproteobacteria bacterium]